MMEEISKLPHKMSGSFRQKLGDIFDLESSGRVILCSALVGVVAGLGAAAFFQALNYVEIHVLGGMIGYIPPDAGTEISGHEATMPSAWWLVLLVPTLGGLLCGLLVYRSAPEAEGHGTDAMVRSFHRLRGAIRARVPLVKAVASILTIGSGGSAGREGPIAQIGSGFGSFLASRLGLNDWERRQLLLAGAAGGIGAIFRAPLGGALFVVEVLYASTAIEFSAIVPCVVSSVIAYSVFVAIFGTGKALTIENLDLTFSGYEELPSYLIFAVLCALAGFLYVSTFYGLRDRVFKRINLPNALKPAIGGFLVGLIALKLPQVMSGGYGWIQEAINGQLTYQFMLLLGLAKIIATGFTISSGGSGGVFAPSLFIGAMLGGAYGLFANELSPDLVPQPATYVLVGMGGFFAGVAKVPLTALIMVSEMCGSYDLLVPMMLVTMVNVAVLSSRWTLYEEQVPSMIDSPAHLGDFVVDVLARIHVRSVYRVNHPIDLVPQQMPLPKIIKLVASSQNTYFPVVDDDQHLVGVFSLHDIRSILEGERSGGLILAADIATFPVLTVTPDDDLHTALRRFTRKNIDELPIVDIDDPLRVIGMLRRKEVIGAYDEQLAAMRHEGSD